MIHCYYKCLAGILINLPHTHTHTDTQLRTWPKTKTKKLASHTDTDLLLTLMSKQHKKPTAPPTHTHSTYLPDSSHTNTTILAIPFGICLELTPSKLLSGWKICASNLEEFPCLGIVWCQTIVIDFRRHTRRHIYILLSPKDVCLGLLQS